MIEQITDPALREAIAREVLARLPDWLSFPEATQGYISGVRDCTFWADTEGEVLRGFIALRPTAKKAAELYVLGVLPEYHRKGVGRALFTALESWLLAHKYDYLTVKTVKPGVWESYDKTNAFYEAMGFTPLMLLPELWDEKNPCQVYIKRI